MPFNPNDALPGYVAVEHIDADACDLCAFEFKSRKCFSSPDCSGDKRQDGCAVYYAKINDRPNGD